MKNLYLIIPLLLVITINPDALAQKSVYTFPFDNEKRLPAMNASIDREGISNTYQTTGHIFTTEFSGPGDKRMEQRSMTYISDERVIDAIRFLEYYIDDQLLEKDEIKIGWVEMSIIYFNEKNRFSFGSVCGILTLGIGTLCGIPYSKGITDVEIEARFYDNDDRLISKYRGVGRGKSPQSIFSMSTRKAHQKAMRNSLTNLNIQIMSDTILFFNQESSLSHP